MRHRLRPRLAAHLLAAPAHLDVEVTSALARRERGGQLSAGDLPSMVDDLVRAPITRYPVLHLTPAACAMRATVAIADAYYVALAAGLDAALVTVDERLANACGAATLCAVASL